MAKSDDDVWLNFHVIAPFLRTITPPKFVSGVLFGAGSPVLRDPLHSQSVSKADRPDDFFPAYISGMLYVFPSHLASHILQTAKTIKNYWIDDTFITGEQPGDDGIVESTTERN